MAGDWIKMRTCLATDPAVIGIASSLDINEFEVVGMLHHLWAWADTQSRDGHAAGVTAKWINRFCQRDGFAEQMQKAGWLEITESGITLPNFDRHNGEPAKTRALATNRKKKQRSNVTDESGQVSRNDRDESVTREEKRREEVNQKLLSSPDGADQPTPKISYVKIAEIYNKTCGAVLPKCEALNAKRKTNIRNLCALQIRGEFPFRKAEFWEGYFNDCLENQHWIGRNDRGWRADLEFLTRTDSALKVLEAA